MTNIRRTEAWYSYVGGKYDSGAPYFFDAQDFDWAAMIEKNFSLIKKETEAYLYAKGALVEDYFNHDLVEQKATWKVGKFYFWGTRYADTCDYIPGFEKLLLSIPGFVSAAVSIMEPGADILPHYGDTDTTMRLHVGVKIPAPYPTCGIEVGTEQHGWEEGKVLAFCDANRHRAWNKSKEPRYILIIDILKPQYIEQRKNICANVLSLIALQQAEYKMPFLRKLPGPVRGLVRNLLKIKFI